ncbi:MAG: Maf-like protein [Euryarchaeota archaeon]|nr:Maf-like protein [Euryarchaeota archaeon]
MRRLHLASASERRLAWLEEKLTNIEISASALMLEEPKPRWGAPVDEQVEFTCVAKAEAAAREGVVGQMAGKEVAEIIVVSDTMVTDPDDPLMPMGKPEDGQHAMAMLLRLSGNRHRVWSSTALVYPPDGQGEHSLHGGWSADIWTESAVVEFNHLSQERLIELVSSESWKGKAGAYDLAGAASQDARLVDGEEVTVLGFAPSAICKLESM